MTDPTNSSIAVCRRVERRRGLLLKREGAYERVCQIGYRGDTHLVSLDDIRRVRKECRLDAANGHDS